MASITLHAGSIALGSHTVDEGTLTSCRRYLEFQHCIAAWHVLFRKRLLALFLNLLEYDCVNPEKSLALSTASLVETNKQINLDYYMYTPAKRPLTSYIPRVDAFRREFYNKVLMNITQIQMSAAQGHLR